MKKVEKIRKAITDAADNILSKAEIDNLVKQKKHLVGNEAFEKQFARPIY